MKTENPLQQSLRYELNNASCLVILGIGSVLRGDDSAGLAVVSALQSLVRTRRRPKILVMSGETAPENFTGAIKNARPSHLLIIDSAQMGLTPGAMKLLQPWDPGGVSFSTHALPLPIMLEYLKTTLPELHIILVGIQPKTLELNAPLSPEVKSAVELLTGYLKACLET